MSDEQEESGPRIARFKPYYFKPVPGRTYLWCSCGRSANQPFCDGSHKGSSFSPMKYDATESKTVFFCGCKHTHGQPFCDGSHARQGFQSQVEARELPPPKPKL